MGCVIVSQAERCKKSNSLQHGSEKCVEHCHMHAKALFGQRGCGDAHANEATINRATIESIVIHVYSGDSVSARQP